MHAHTPAREIIHSTLPFSRYLQRLLESESELLSDLEENLYRPFLREEMLAFLNANSNNTCDEAGLRYVTALRRMR